MILCDVDSEQLELVKIYTRSYTVYGDCRTVAFIHVLLVSLGMGAQWRPPVVCHLGLGPHAFPECITGWVFDLGSEGPCQSRVHDLFRSWVADPLGSGCPLHLPRLKNLPASPVRIAIIV